MSRRTSSARVVDVEDLRLVLEPVARPHVVDGDGTRHSHDTRHDSHETRWHKHRSRMCTQEAHVTPVGRCPYRGRLESR